MIAALPENGKTQKDDAPVSSRIAKLRQKIDNKDYLDAAIQRIAHVLSGEILDLPHGGSYHEQRKRWKQSEKAF
jgi:hypothetical protein